MILSTFDCIPIRYHVSEPNHFTIYYLLSGDVAARDLYMSLMTPGRQSKQMIRQLWQRQCHRASVQKLCLEHCGFELLLLKQRRPECNQIRAGPRRV